MADKRDVKARDAMNSYAPPKQSTPAALIQYFNGARGGPVGVDLMRALGAQSDPRSAHWLQMEMQRRRDANGGGMLPEELPANVGLARGADFSGMAPRGPVVSGQPMDPLAYQAMMEQNLQNDVLAKGRNSGHGQQRAIDKAIEDYNFSQTRRRIDNSVMPAEIGSPGWGGRAYDAFQFMIGRKQAM